MADKTQIENSITHKYKDLGDGSFARVVALDGGVTISGPVTVSSEVEIKNDTGNPIPVAGIRPNDGTGLAAGTNHLSVGGSDGTNLRVLATDTSGRAVVVVNSLPEVEVKNDSGNPLAVSGTVTANTGLAQPLTDTQLRATAVAVSGSAAVGVAPTLPPLSVSGVDAGGLKRHVLTDTLGSQSIFASARNCVGRQTITGLSSSTPATLTVPGTAVAATIQADGGQVRITLDGSTAPTASVGQRIDDGVIFYVDTVLASVKLLAQSGSTTNVQISYFDKA